MKNLVGAWVIGLSMFSSPDATAECASSKPVKKWNLEPIGLVVDPRVPAGVVDEAIEYWAACDDYGKGFPSYTTDPLDSRSTAPRIKIKFAKYSRSARCASFHGTTMTLYAFAKHRTGRPIACGSLAQNLAHELGHFLGLRHASKAHDCERNIMSTVKTVNSRTRRVSQEECQVVDSRWVTASERLARDEQLRGRALASLQQP